jgi:hypothetical protein
MSKFETIKELHFEILKNPLKNWINCNDFKMAKAMHDIIFNSTKVVVQGGNFFFSHYYEQVAMD